MKRDDELVRNLLLLVEEISDGHSNYLSEYFVERIPEESSEKVLYHLKYLLDAGLIEGSYEYILDITPSGREYLDTIRDDYIWKKTLQKVQPFGSVTLSVIAEVAKSLLLNKLGL